MSTNHVIKVRVWASTRDRIVEAGNGWPVTRAIDVFLFGYDAAGRERQQEARRVSLDDHVRTDEFQSQLVWPATHRRLEALNRATGLDRTRLIDILSRCWLLLDEDERAAAFATSMAEAATPAAAT